MGDFLKRLPAIYKGGEAARLLEAIEKHRLATEQRIDSLKYYWNPDRCPPERLDVILRLLGWTADIELTERQKRKLVKMATPIHRQIGTARGIINALRYLMGVEVSIREYLKIRYYTDGSTFPPGDRNNYSFDVIFPLTARDEDVAVAKKLIEYMMPPNTYYTPIQLLQNSNTKTLAQSVTIKVNKRFGRNPYDPEGFETELPLLLDGSWKLDGTYYLWGYKALPPERKSDARHFVGLTIKDTNGKIVRSVVL